MAQRHTPDPGPDWRALLDALPPKDDGPPPDTSRQRRRARRRAARRERAAVLSEVRRRPMSPAAVLVLVLLVLVLGTVARCGGRHETEGSDDRPPAAASPPTASALPAPPATEPTDTPDDVAGQWVRAYLTRDPVADGTHRASVRRAAAQATDDLTRNLIDNAPPGWGHQVSRGERTRVVAVAVRPAEADLPPDNPAQVWRKVTATLNVTGYETARRTALLRVELTLTRAGWRVSRVLGV